MEGVNIVFTEIALTNLGEFLCFALTLASICCILLVIKSFSETADDPTASHIISCIVSVILIIVCIVGFFHIDSHCKVARHYVILDSNVPYKEFSDKYEIVEQKGNMVIVVEK